MNQLSHQSLSANFSTVCESLDEGIIIYDVTGKIFYLNNASYKLLGIEDKPNEDLNISNFAKLLYNAESGKAQLPLQEMADTKKPFGTIQALLNTPGSGKKAVALRSIPLGNGKPGYLCIFIRDVSLIHQLTKEINEHDSQLHKTQSLGKIGSWTIDLTSKEVKVTPEACVIYGLDIKPSFSLNEVQQVPLPAYRKTLDETLENLIKKGTPYNVVFKIKRPSDGSIIDIHSVAEYNAISNTVEGVIQDITEFSEIDRKLIESEKKMSSIFRVAPTGIGMVNNRIIVDANPRLCEMTGYTRDELVDNSARMLYPTQEEFEYVGAEKYRQIGIKGTGTVETKWIKKDGTIIHVLLASTPIDTKDLALGVTFTALDITQNKTYQQSLIESESKYRLLVENQTDLLVKVDPTGRFLFVSPSYCKMFGKTEEELLGNTFMPLVHEDDREATQLAMKTLWEPPHTVYIEQRAMTLEGWVWLAWVDTAITDADGNVIEIIGVGRNISQQKESEFALQRAFENWQRTFNAMRDGVALLDAEHNILQSNSAFQALVKHTNDEMQGNKCYAFVHGSECPIPECPHVRMLKSRQRETMELEVNNQIFEVIVDPIIDGKGHITGSVHIMADITQRKKAQRAVKKYAERLEQAEQNAHLGSWEYNVKTGETWLSKQLLIMLSIEQTNGAPDFGKFVESVHPDDQLRVLEDMTLIRNGKIPTPDEFRSHPDSGEIHYFLPNVFIEKDDNGEVLRISGTIINITQQKKTENSLRESEERWHFALEGAGDGIWDWNMATNEIYFSDQWKRMLGYEPDEMENKFSEWESRVHPNDLHKALDDIQQHKEGKTNVYLNEHRLLHKDGSYRWILDRGKIISHDEKGNPLRFIGTHTDITHRKGEEAELRMLKDNLQFQVEEQTHLLKERLAELERFHEATIEREFRIKELRDQVEQLKRELNEK